mgnify:CR=1 FL=1
MDCVQNITARNPTWTSPWIPSASPVVKIGSLNLSLANLFSIVPSEFNNLNPKDLCDISSLSLLVSFFVFVMLKRLSPSARSLE